MSQARNAPPSDSVDERLWTLDAIARLDEGVIIVDENARQVYGNPAVERLVGFKILASDPTTWSKEIGVFRWDETTLVPTEELPLVSALRGKPIRDMELFVRNEQVPRGIHLLCTSTTLTDATGRIRGAAIIFRDVTAQRLHEQEIREAERQKKAILDNIPHIAWLKDKEGRFLAVNQQLLDSVAKSRAEEVLGLTDLDLFPRELAERYRIDDAEVMHTGRRLRIEEPFVDASGREYWIETFKTRIVSDGVVIGTTGIARDITERKRVEEALRTSRDELEHRVRERTSELARANENLVRKERLAVLGQLAGGVAHQIRNPLAAIMNATYVLKRHLSPEQHPNVEDAIRIIHDEVRHANVIITSLLDYARVRTPDRHPTNLVELVERVLAAEEVPSNVTVERSLSAVPSLDVDADQIHGALVNLVRNALEAMSDGGTLGVELHAEPDAVVISVSDTGPGISTQVRGHLFEPLHSTKPLGIGLGLVTARTLVEAHGGTIACVDVAVGARFDVRLPRETQTLERR